MELTELLAEWPDSGQEGLDAVLPLIYEELRILARRHVADLGSTPTLQPTMLVHEAYLRLSESKPQRFAGRRQFFAFASRVIRHVLVDHIRTKLSLKRGAGQVQGLDDLEDMVAVGDGLSPDLVLAVHEALEQLEKVDGRQARIVEMKFFGGMKQTEIAEALDVSLPTVERHWRAGRRRLILFLKSDGPAPT